MELKQAFWILRHGSGEGLREYLKAVKTIEDNCVPVVRCRECVHAKNAKVNGRGFRICPASGMEIVDDDFCSYGERQRMPEAGLNPSEVNIEKPGQRLIDANGLIQKAGPIPILDMAPTIEAIAVKENEEHLRKCLKDMASFDDLEKRQERKEG